MSHPEANESQAFARPRWRDILPPVCLALLATVLVILFWDGGTLEGETLTFMANYTAERPLLQKVFDPHANDFGTYQARELSYFFDCVDALVYKSVVARFDASFFIPATALVLPVLFAVVFAFGVRRSATNIDGITAGLVLACFFSSFVFVSTLGLFYRSGKPLLSVILLALLFHLRWIHRCRVPAPNAPKPLLNRDTLVVIALALIAGLLDLQGVFYVMAAFGILLVHYLLTRQMGDVVVASGLAAIALQAYNLALGPWLIHRLNGYHPNFGYQELPLHEFPIQFVPAIHQLFSNAQVMFGGFLALTLVCVGVFIAVMLRAAARRGAESPPMGAHRLRASGRALIYVVLAVAANVVMFTLMISRHPQVYYWMDHRHWYYPLPWLAIVLFGVVTGLNAVLPALDRSERRWLQGLFAVLVLGNLASLSHYKKLMLTGPWFGPVHAQSERLKAYLRTGADDPQLASNFRDFGARIRDAPTGGQRK